MLNRIRLQHFILIGLLAWGLPGIYLGGAEVLFAVVAVTIPVWVSLWRSRGPEPEPHQPSTSNYGLLIILLVSYFLLDAIFGRQKFAQNLFFSTSAVNDFIDSANAGVSQGRGVIDLLGAVTVFTPFALFDYARNTTRKKRLLLYFLVMIFIVYEIGISRGYLLMAMLSIFMGVTTNNRRLIIAVAGSLGIFVLASYVRGDFQDVAFSNPLFDALGWPYINLAMLLEKNVDGGGWIDFLLEFFKKFLPSFIYPKEIFSFNVEMTKIIYPHFGEYIQSVSVFTYIGELLYYKPPILTSTLAGILLGLLARFLERIIKQNSLNSTRIFSGLMCVVLLRSRIQDVFSFLIFLAIFLSIWTAIVGRQPLRLDSHTSNPNS